MRIRMIVLFLLLLIFLPYIYANINSAVKAATIPHEENLGIVLEVKGVISPAIQDYVERGITEAEESHAKLIILELNTPGGLESSMRGINEAIIKSTVPIIVFVYPSGAHAASAGTFIAYAGHLVAMTPGSNIGAASPVDILATTTTSPDKLTTEQKKVINDAAAYIRSLAQMHGKNEKWAESAVRESASISTNEAKNLKVIDIIANDYPDLLQKLHDQPVKVQGGTVKLDTKNIKLVTISPGWRYQFLSFITNPNIAYLLLLIAIYGIFFEFSTPGMVLPGVAGVIALLLVLYAFQIMPINYAGLTLILVGIVFMVCEVYIATFGIVGFAGAIAFIIGSIMLFDFNDPHYQLTRILIILMCVLTLTFFFVVLNLAIRSHKKEIVTGKEGLIGKEGVVLEVMNEQTVVQVLGEIWEAKAQQMLNRGQKVKVIGISGLVLIVKPLTNLSKKGEE